MAHASGSRVAEPKAYATFCVTVPDVQEALDKVGKAGGATVTPPMDVPTLTRLRAPADGNSPCWTGSGPS